MLIYLKNSYVLNAFRMCWVTISCSISGGAIVVRLLIMVLNWCSRISVSSDDSLLCPFIAWSIVSSARLISIFNICCGTCCSVSLSC
mmetsp:Transcript_15067/g.24484  ORF Transcript_15067/g.24484 Transcript_15067/m.24484 type:complete len:87 (+) Transcript_15067:358-618(+)